MYFVLTIVKTHFVNAVEYYSKLESLGGVTALTIMD